ncbi:MAG: insulinase family protein [Fimbriimonadaceae bacterium]|nr:insulinase family protein [Fimbriimonadaceae bacterium]
MRLMRGLRSLTYAVLLLAAPLAAAPVTTLPAGVTAGPSIEGISEYRLANGLRVLLFPDDTKDTVTVCVTYLVGSRHENYGEGGMAHLFEHLMFRSASRHQDIKTEGTQRGAQWNGTTSYDRTNYYETLQATPENLEWALDLEADRMTGLQIAAADIAAERTIVQNEMDSGENEVGRQMVFRVAAAAFQWHNYGRSTIGLRSDLEAVPLERVLAFYRHYYQPDNAVLVVAGKCDPAATLALVQRKFGPLPRPGRTLLPTYTVEPPQIGEQEVVVRLSGGTPGVLVGYHVPATAHPDSAALEVLGWVLNDPVAGRLQTALVKTGLATGSSAFNFRLRDPSLLLADADAKADQPLPPLRDALLQVLEGLAGQPLLAAEVERAKADLGRRYDQALFNPQRVATSLSEWASQGDWRLFFLHRDRVAAVTVEDVQRVATTYLKPTNRTVGLYYPTANPARVTIPAAPDLAKLLEGYQGRAAVATGEAFEATPATMDARTQWSTSAGGLKMALLPRKTRGNEVWARITVRFGDLASLQGRAPAAEMAGRLLLRGSARYTRQQIQDEITRLKADVSVSGGLSEATIAVRTTRDNLAAALTLGAEVLRHPTFPAADLEELRTRALTDLESDRTDPQAVLGVRLGQLLNPYPAGDPRHVDSPDEEAAALRALTLEQVHAFHREFYGASSGEVAVTGDFDAAALPPLVEQLLGGWQTTRPYTRIPRPFVAVAAQRVLVDLADKPNGLYQAVLPLAVRDDDPQYAAGLLVARLLGGGADSRLWKRLREKDGLSYGVGASFSANAIDTRGVVAMGGIFPARDLAKFEAALNEEVANLLRDGFTAEEVTKGREALLLQRRTARAADAGMVASLADHLFLGRKYAWEAALDEQLGALSADQVNAALRRFVKPEALLVGVAGDLP